MNPILFPNFHSICDKTNSLNSNSNRFAFSSQLDFDSLGHFWEMSPKHNRSANFHGLSPTLPFFVNRSQPKNNFVAKNCLTFCKNGDKRLILTSEKTNLIGLLLRDNRVEGCDQNIEAIPHFYSRDESISCGPFRYRTQKVYDIYVDDEVEEDFRPIREIKIHSEDDIKTEVQTNSRNKIRFYRFEDSNLNLNLFNELMIEDFRRSDNSLFEFCDRNQLIDNQLLISCTKDNVINLYDLESNQKTRSIDCESNSKFNQIGLQWSQSHPMMFFIGDNKRLKYCDSRVLNPVLEFYAKKNSNSFEWELIYQFLPSKLNENQVFVATDYHIFVADIRYPNINLNQSNHMIPNTIIQNLKSLEVFEDNSKTELIICTNFQRNCLMSFKSSDSEFVIPLISQHFPIHLSNPKDIDKQFEDYFYRGVELIDSTDSSGFSLALLTNLNDIFIQDLFWFKSEEEMMAEEGEPQYKDRTFSTGLGSNDLKLDIKTEQYMEVIQKFLYRLKSEEIVEFSNLKECKDCGLHRNCILVNDMCQCRNPPNSSTHLKTSKTKQMSETERKDFIKSIYDFRCGIKILDIKKRLEDQTLLETTTDRITKNILKVWSLGIRTEETETERV